ncbi:MarR family transcriptional regulator [Pseudomonas sp. dw_358]|uniref:MarR family winged helix-turn-helix transcriptional regulator n=1 Tax=Pseudomonas sp. dw_358 TaxID=2720083 RepID=UPI001BD4AF77|nr:MarR family transcriptional regulator [Pseudomonas sp. dw_358]
MTARVERDELGDLGLLLSFYIRCLSRIVSKDLDDELEGLEVAKGTGKIGTLLLVNEHPGIRPSTLARWLLKDRAAMGRIIEQMAVQGLLTRRVSDKDNRAQELYASERGRELAATVTAIVTRQSRTFFQDLDDAEHALAIRLLRKVYRRVAGFNEAFPTGAPDAR